MRFIRESNGLGYTLRFIYNGINAHECMVDPHNMERMITKVWRELDADDILYEEIPYARLKAVRFPGHTYK